MLRQGKKLGENPRKGGGENEKRKPLPAEGQKEESRAGDPALGIGGKEVSKPKRPVSSNRLGGE